MGQRRPWPKRIRRRITRSTPFVAAIAWVAAAFIAAHAKLVRITFHADPELEALDPRRVLYGFWHGRQYLLVHAFRDQGIAIMTDRSWAGEIQTRILKRFGYVTVRGSSRRGAASALAAMERAIESGHPAAFALDGPSGPPFRSKPGILHLAAKLGYPIVPVATSARPAWILRNTWCEYLLPLPFARCRIARGAPIRAAADGTLAAEELDRIVGSWTAEVDRAVGRADGDSR
jgi:lysophospholipid acyltransferase (LPLAT)-like uncharacterized protein